MKISWSEENPRRRFHGCGNYNLGKHYCNFFFIWHDPPTNAFHVNLFNKLVKEIRNLKVEFESKILLQKLVTQHAKVVIFNERVDYYKRNVKKVTFVILCIAFFVVSKWVLFM